VAKGTHHHRLQFTARLVVVVLLAGAPLSFGQTNSLSEYQIKAAILFNFAKFVEWPESGFRTPQSSFTICMLGKDPFGHFLDDLLLNKTIVDRPIVVERLKDKSNARHCQMVFVSPSEQTNLLAIMDSLQGANVLLVGETHDFAASGGTIELTLENNHVRFTINLDAANRAGLRIDSRLLALATIVHDEGKALPHEPR
jgi:hypothetical protein